MAETALFGEHERLSATITDFHGWRLPAYYSTPIGEHNAVRERAGLFDVSHMGEILVEGSQAEALLERLLVRRVSGMKPGEMRLAVMCNEKGGILDDLTVYKFSDRKFWLVVNAGPYEKDLWWAQENGKGFDVSVRGLRHEKAKLDIQGPKSLEILQKLCEKGLGGLKRYGFAETPVCGVEAVASRSGYTGEDGFEIYLDKGGAEKAWAALLEAGREFGLVPCGLASRDTLRLESGMLLFGQDIDEKKTPLQCYYEKLVCWEKDFLGKDALESQKAEGVKERLVGFELLERGIARQGCRMLSDGAEVGLVTSGTYSPTLKKGIGLGYIGKDFSAQGTNFQVEIRGNKAGAAVTGLPFYKRGG